VQHAAAEGTPADDRHSALAMKDYLVFSVSYTQYAT